MEENSVSVSSVLDKSNAVEPSSSLNTVKMSSIVEQNSLQSNSGPTCSSKFASSDAAEATTAEDEPDEQIEKPTGAVNLYSNNNIPMTEAAVAASTSRTSTISSSSTSATSASFSRSSMLGNIDNSNIVASTSTSGRQGEAKLRDPVQNQNPVNPVVNEANNHQNPVNPVVNEANNHIFRPVYFSCPFCPFRIASSVVVTRILREHYQHHRQQWAINRARRIRRARGSGGSR